MQDPLDYGTQVALARCAEIERAIASGESGKLFEDEYVTVERHCGRVFVTGKPFRSVLMYGPDPRKP